jgi:hypothetical protein
VPLALASWTFPMVASMADANKAINISDCIQKEADYYAMARAATDPG